MAKLVAENHPALHQIAEEVEVAKITSPKIQKVIKDLRDTLLKCPRGVAIAAPQIGIPLRIFVVHDSTADNTDRDVRIPDMVAVNPKIIKTSKKKEEMEEGCLSVPNRYGRTVRHNNVTIRAYDEKGQPFERGAGGLLAQIFQHEVDHLDGILYVDHAKETWAVDDNYEPLDKDDEAEPI